MTKGLRFTGSVDTDPTEGGFVQERELTDTDHADGVGRVIEVRKTSPVITEEEFVGHMFRLTAIAYQMTMSREEAVAKLLPRLPSAIGSVLP